MFINLIPLNPLIEYLFGILWVTLNIFLLNLQASISSFIEFNAKYIIQSYEINNIKHTRWSSRYLMQKIIQKCISEDVKFSSNCRSCKLSEYAACIIQICKKYDFFVAEKHFAMWIFLWKNLVIYVFTQSSIETEYHFYCIM